MHIVMLTDRMDIGGAETHIDALCRALLGRGHRITLLSSGGCYARQLEEAGVHTVFWPADRRTPSAILRCALCLRRVLRDRTVDLLHAHTRFTATLASRLFGGRCPTVSTAHLPFPCSARQRRLMRWGVHTLAVSADIREHLKEVYGLCEEGLTLTVNGIDTDRFAVLPSEGGAIVHTSRFDPDRAATALLLCAIAPRLLTEHPERRIHLIGDGAWGDRVRAAAAEANRALGFEGVRVFPKTAELPTALREGCLFVGVSRAALEAMSMGLPVILAGNEGYGGILDEGGLAEAASTNLCARGRPVADAERLYRDISALLSEEGERRRLGRFGARTVRTAFCADRMAKDALSVYRRVLAPKSAFIIGYYGYGNLGDEATLSLIKSALLKRNIYNIHIFSKENSEDGSHIKRTRLFAVRRLIRTSDLILFGGGNLLQNETSRRSFFLYSRLLQYAHKRRRRILMISTGLGRVDGRMARARLGKLLTYPAALFLRTAADEREARLLLSTRGDVPYIGRAHDLCFQYEATPAACTKRRVLFILRTLADREALFSLQVAVGRLRSHGYTVAFLILHSTQDHTLSYRLSGLFSAPVLTADSVLSFAQHTMDACLVITERLHGAILSLLCHIPCYLSTDSVKGRRLIADVVRAAHGLAMPSPLLGFDTLSSLLGRLFATKGRSAVRTRRLCGRVHGGLFSFLHTLSFAHSTHVLPHGGHDLSHDTRPFPRDGQALFHDATTRPTDGQAVFHDTTTHTIDGQALSHDTTTHTIDGQALYDATTRLTDGQVLSHDTTTRPIDGHGVYLMHEKKQVGGAQASDFGRLLRELRAGASWESFAFYEDM